MILIAAISVLWGLNWPAMKLAVGELSPWTFRVVCVVVSGAGLMLLAVVAGERLRLPRGFWLPLLGIAALSVTGWHMFSAFGLQHIEGGRGAIVAFTMPIWAAIFSALFLREQVGGRQIGALALGMLGIGVLIGPDLLLLGRSPLGPALMIAAAVCWGAGIVVLKSKAWPIGVMALTAWQLILGGLPILLVWLVIEPRPDLSHLTWKGVAATFYASTVALIFCFAAHNKVVTLLPATAAAISTLAIPVVGLLSSAWLLGEPAGPREFGALALVLAAMAMVLLKKPAGRAS